MLLIHRFIAQNNYKTKFDNVVSYLTQLSKVGRLNSLLWYRDVKFHRDKVEQLQVFNLFPWLRRD